MTDTAGFIAGLVPGAQQAQQEHGVPASLTLAQAILESGWGTTEISTKAHNFFGQKAHLGDHDPYQIGQELFWTWEVEAGVRVSKQAYFYVYPDAAASLKAHALYLTGQTGIVAYQARPLPVGADAWARWIVTPPRGYATDPLYPAKLRNLMDLYNLRSYDNVSAPTAPPKGPSVTDIIFGFAPSAQGANAYAAGLGTEKQHMDRIVLKALALLKPLEKPGLKFDAYTDGNSYADNIAVSNARGWTYHSAIHSNADADPTNNVTIPTMAFWYPGSVVGEKLARALAIAVAAVSPLGLGQLYARSDLGELKSTNAKAGLVELREHDTVAGATDLTNREDAYARALAQGAVVFLNAQHGFSLSLGLAPVTPPATPPVTDPLSTSPKPILTAPSRQPRVIDYKDAGWIKLWQRIVGVKDDGVNGPTTRGKIKALQTSVGLTGVDVDGLPGKKTAYFYLKSRGVLKKGDVNHDVALVQWLVLETPDENFGPATEKSVIGVQIWWFGATSPEVDGKAGPHTDKALCRVEG